MKSYPIGFSGWTYGTEWHQSGKRRHNVFITKCVRASSRQFELVHLDCLVFHREADGTSFPGEATIGVGKCDMRQGIAAIDIGVSLEEIALPDEQFQGLYAQLYRDAAEKLATYVRKKFPDENVEGFLKAFHSAIDRYAATPVEEIFRIAGDESIEYVE